MIRKIIVLSLVSIFVFGGTSCAIGESSLYSWDQYENVTYNFTKDPSDNNREKLIACYDKIILKQKGTRKTVPPGMYAEKAFILIGQNKKQEAIELLNQEMVLYPESKSFIEKIISQLNK